ncbi:hypothetical protein XENORESO_004094 [Xenotaenia resolanae]|uniref:Uncharacterized protein n=1 Tax=Xenotaenia resolanae TaxID=208358 RepID=A0ABV0WPL1_9TELE
MKQISRLWRCEDTSGTSWRTIVQALCAHYPESPISLPKEDRGWRPLDFDCRLVFVFTSFQRQTTELLEVHSCFSCSEKLFCFFTILCILANNIFYIIAAFDFTLIIIKYS